MELKPYLFFTGNCAEAMQFYKEVFGGELSVMPNPDGQTTMHADLRGGGINLLASDGDRRTPYETSYATLCVVGTDKEAIVAAFERLSEGGTITEALRTESWGDTFGTVTDKFGIDWMVNISAR